MPEVVYILVVTVLTCLAGVGAFVLLWPRDPSRARPFRSWPLTVLVLGVAAPGIITIPIFTADFLSDNGFVWLRWAFYGACAASVGLIGVALVGDRSRGRRRCPRCWYDMGATPGLTCPECGRPARRERSLFRSRRRLVLFPAALIPVVAILVPWNALHYRGPEWAKNLSNTAFVLAYPLARGNLTYCSEVDRSFRDPGERRNFSSWQRALLARFARSAQADAAQPRKALAACEVLTYLGADDRVTVETLSAIAASSPMYMPRAVEMLGYCYADPPAAKATLMGLLTGPDPTASYLAGAAIVGILPRAPGGPAPDVLFNGARIGAAYSPELVVQLLRSFDPCDKTRAALVTALDTPRTRPGAIVSLAALWPRDSEFRANLLNAVRFVPDASMDSDSVRVVYGLVFDELARRDRLGAVAPERLALYTPELCDELEKWLPLLDRNDAEYGRLPERACGRMLRQVLDEARASHARKP